MKSDIAKVIDRTDLIENLINQIIVIYLLPGKEGFFWDVFLDSSIIPLGTKVKILIIIAQEVGFKIDQNAIRRVVNLRNAFAHHGLHSHPIYIVGKTPEEDKLSYQLKVITGSSKVKRMSRLEALEEFNNSYDLARKTLVEIKKAISNQQL